MTGIGALAYADGRAVVNSIGEIARNPARAALWSAFILLLIGLAVFRTVVASHGTSDAATLVRCDYFVCGAPILFGLALGYGGRFAGLFANRAEARWIIGSPVPPFAATVYIQLRETIRRCARQGLTLAYIAILYLPHAVGPWAFARDLGYVALALLVIGIVPLPRRLAHGTPAAVATVAAWAIMGLGALPVVHDLAAYLPVGSPLEYLLVRLPDWHPGIVLLEPTGVRSILVFAVLLAAAAAALAVLGNVARDGYPEIYACSIEALDRVERVRTRGRFERFRMPGRLVPEHARSLRAARVPHGVFVFVWRSWTEYRRTHTPRGSAFETALPLVLAFVVAKAIGSEDETWFALSGAPLSAMIVASITFGSSLGAELRKPLFWVSGRTLFERLAGMLLAQTWRPIGWVLLTGLGLAGGGAPAFVLAGVLLFAPVLVVLVAATGYVAFSIAPAQIDQRGPMAFVRLLLAYVLTLPSFAVGVGAGILAQSVVAGIAAAAVAALAETVALVGVASWRLARAATSTG